MSPILFFVLNNLLNVGYNFVLRNDSGNYASPIYPIPNLKVDEKGSVAWADYDGDRDLDMLIAGTESTRIYKNNGQGNFSSSNVEILDGVNNSISAWGKDDNESYLILTDTTDANGISVTRTILYTYNGTNFVKVSDNLFPGITPHSIDFGDYDDGNLDLILTGLDSLNPQQPKGITRIYHGNGDGTFDLGAPLTPPIPADFEGYESGDSYDGTTDSYDPGVVFGDAAWGDYDQDGDLDLILTGASNEFYTQFRDERIGQNSHHESLPI